ncbi:putative uncharacterized protein [Waddlia chondrophila 2032/99]|uniref:LPS-assembly protein LptD n=2 Tax=Waddlia chondrophila TaxID=71667 RepID=D6YWL3_WADCW|nr:hypothetical protein [Waddlia chondrophila]ADI38524.1 conserved hypothetical protein [Waddlia chondrophila WSU 86-1044]CCB91607.1 putative uncharacterized protein [Waddlia chondrophila 2032/99]
MKKILFFFLFPLSLLQGIDIDIENPSYENGKLTTEDGGVITAPNFRLQALRICYDSSNEQSLLEAEKNIILEFGEYFFVGKQLVYDFKTKTGVLYHGRTAVDQWYIGGEEIHLCADGSFYIRNGFATTSENARMDWQLETGDAHLKDHHMLTAKDVKFRFIALPIFWMPKIHLDLNALFDPPVRFNIKVGGTRGSKVGFIYKLYSTPYWQTNLKVDYRVKSGFGGGIESYYRSPCKCTSFSSINYISDDKTRFDSKTRTRYRLEGNYHTQLNHGKTTVDATWDKLSDYEMASDYDDADLYLVLANPTQLYIRHQESNWIASILTRVRINQFQTLKQELPTLYGAYRPFEIGSTGILSAGKFEASYLELEYTNNSEPDINDYNSPRYEASQSFWKPLKAGAFTMTPEVGMTAIYYGNSKKRSDRWMAIGQFELDMRADLYRFYGDCKHVLTPYLRYQYYTFPTTSPDDHFIFDINDGWYRLNALRLGLLNNFYCKSSPCCIYRKLYLDLYTYAFFDTKTIEEIIPKTYARVIYNFTDRMRHSNLFVWDFQHQIVDQFNSLLEWTINTTMAVALEYRHRSPYAWRKVDATNFILDSFRSVDDLEKTLLSDRRDTFLYHFYWKFHPTWAFAFQSRNGWNRKDEVGYKEFQVTLLGTFRSSWNVKMDYKHREHDDRFSIHFSVGLNRPCYDYNACRVPCLEF